MRGPFNRELRPRIGPGISVQEWEQAVGDFSERIRNWPPPSRKPLNAAGIQRFVRSFDDFCALCRQAINPNLSEEAVERMLVQHLLLRRPAPPGVPRALRRQPAARVAVHSLCERSTLQQLSFRTGFSR
jgi:hypothetical protein